MSFYKKRKKSSRFRGSHTHSRGFKKKARGSGHRGGFGMAGTGKRADQRKPSVLNEYGKSYFGKKIALRRKIYPKPKSINIRTINDSIYTLVKKGIAKEIGKNEYELNLKGYKILSEGEPLFKMKIKASAASKTAIDKIKKIGGDIVVS